MGTTDEKWARLLREGKARWVPGMTTDGMLVVDADETGIDVVRKGVVQEWSTDYARPDFTDPATLGALLGLVRKRWGKPRISAGACTRPDGTEYWDVGYQCFRWVELGAGPTEAEALLAALDAMEP